MSVIGEGLHIGQVDGGARVDDIVPKDDGPTLQHPVLFQALEIWPVQMLDMVDKDHIIWPIVLNKLRGIFDSPHMNLDDVTEACVLYNFPGNVREELINFDGKNSCALLL